MKPMDSLPHFKSSSACNCDSSHAEAHFQPNLQISTSFPGMYRARPHGPRGTCGEGVDESVIGGYSHAISAV